MSQIITGKLSLNLRWVDVISTVEAAIDTLAPAIAAKNIEMVTDFDPTVGRIFGDAGRLQQVAWNLLEVRKMERTFAREESACCKNLSPASVEIEVSDTGQGISEEFLPHVFERFSQADSSIRRSYNGLGLGLALVRHFVEMHGGTVQAESAGKGKGSRFLVKLPIQQHHCDGGLSVTGLGEWAIPQ
ncbi:HAMP domain-containing sensor histidine kinase, partial [Microcoleus sp. HI-ES]|nr:HAMP domain-containing sensor histidine kinase [Microcoleus sp. HI-ES]